MANKSKKEQFIQIPIGSVSLSGDLTFVEGSPGIVLFAHGSGSGRHSKRNRYVAKVLQDAGLGTLLFDLLTEDEEVIDEQTRRLRFDIGLLTDRLIADRKSTRLNSSHANISYAVFCLKKNNYTSVTPI